MAAKYWVWWTDSRNATAWVKRSTTSWWVGGAAVPWAWDDVFFDANSWSVTVTKSTTTTHISVNFTWFTGTFAWVWSLTITSSLIFSASMTRTWLGILWFTGTCIINTNWITTASTTSINSWSLTLQNNWNNSTNTITLVWWTFDMNWYNIRFWNFVSTTTNIRTVSLWSGTIELTSSGTIRSPNITNFTLNQWTSTIRLTNWNVNPKSFNGQWLTYNNFWNDTTNTGICIIISSNTWNTIKINAGRDQRFWASTIHYMQDLDAIWTWISNINIDSSTSTPHQLSKIWWWTIQVEYCVIQRSEAQETNTRYANNSTDNGWNTNWIFWPASITWQISKVFFM